VSFDSPLVRALPLVLALFASRSLAAQSTGDLRVGHWVEVKGVVERGTLIASEVELLPPAGEQALTGTVERMLAPTRFVVLGQEVHASAKTELRKVQLGDLTGTRVKVEGHYRGPRNFSAGTIASRGPGREAIEGRIDQLHRTPEGLELRIMGFRVRVPAAAGLELAAPLETIELAPLEAFATGPEAGTRDDDDEIYHTLQLAENLYVGGQVEYELDRSDNFDLNDARDADQQTNSVSLRLELVWEPSSDAYFLAGARTSKRWRKDEDDPDDQDENTTLSELYGYFRDLGQSGWDLQVGRQDFDERREWLYDQNLDAVRAIRSAPDWRLELSLSSVLLDGNERDEDDTNFVAYLSNNDLRRHAAAYVVHRQAAADERATHVGLRAHGDWLENQDSWVEAAYLTGEDGVDLGSYGFDLGTTWTPERLPGLALTAGYALGSGDGDPTDGDASFRQTGLQDNNGKFAGVTSFRYYGELFDPELSNLGIVTLGVGVRPMHKSSIDLVLHKYDQVEAFAGLRNTNLRRRPSGDDTDLGWEADLVFGSRRFDNLHIEVVGAYFEPGDAFPGGDPAWLGRIQLRYKF